MSLLIAEKSLEICAEAISAIGGKRATLDDCLDRVSGDDCRSICTHLLMNFFRNQKSIDKNLFNLISAKKTPLEVQSLLRAALTRMFFQERVDPASTVNVAVECAKKFHFDKLVNAVLRRAGREKFTLPDTVEEILPDEVLKVWTKRFDDDTLCRLTSLFVGRAPQSFRLCGKNSLEKDAPAEEIPSFGDFKFFQTDAPEYFKEKKLLEKGVIYWQDPATSFAVSLPDYSNVKSAIDLCASPGGKLLMLGEKLPENAKLVALDKSARRQQLTRENCERYGCRAEVAVGDAAKIEGAFDLVLADVPCSNSGVFRRRPDVLWRFSGEEVGAVNVEQRRILENAAKLVNDGGQLLYSTCSIEPEENDDTIRDFLDRHPEFERVSGAILLPGEFSDGAGATLLRKKK